MSHASDKPLRTILAEAAQSATERRRLLAELSGAQQRLAEQDRQMADLTTLAEQFVDNVSHEFRTPLTVIREFASILRDGLAGAVTEAQRRYLELIIDRNDDLSLLVEDLLDMGKCKAGLLTTRRKHHRMADIVAPMRPVLTQKAELKGMTLEIDLGDGLPMAFCDAEQIQRILANLVSNALKFSDRGSRVQLWARVASATEIVLGVSDSGPGISAADAAVVFEPFFQLDGPARFSTRGFGLGLAVAKRLAAANLGQIMLASQPGDGSTFSFTIPRSSVAAIVSGYRAMLEQPEHRIDEVSLVEVDIDTAAEPRWVTAAAEFLHQAIRCQDLLLPGATRPWRLLIAGGRLETAAVSARIETGWAQFRQSPATSSAPPFQLRSAGAWPLELASDGILAWLKDATELTEPATDTASQAHPSQILHSALRDQQRAMECDAWSLLGGLPGCTATSSSG